MNKTAKFYIVTVFAVIAGLFTSCTDYQDEIDALDARVKKLEEMASTMQKNLDNLAFTIDAISDNWFVTSYIPLLEGNDTIGYTINVRKDVYDPVTGKPIEDQKEQKSITIKNGKNGEDAQFPTIVPKQSNDGGWYWVIVRPDGTEDPITDQNGKVVIVAQDGEDAVAPKVRINPTTGEWETSVDNGKTWQTTHVKAEGEKGDTGPKGEKGEKGANAETAIVSIEVIETTQGTRLRLTTAGGNTYILPFIPV